MILSTIAQADRYAGMHPLFPRAFEYIRNTDLHSLAPGCYPIIADELLVIVENVAARERIAAKLECHRKYIDIQLVLQGTDEMGWRPLIECTQPLDDYSAARDVQFFDDAPGTWIVIKPGMYCIFFPEDAHAPLVGKGHIRKVVFKIAAASADAREQLE